VDEHNIELKRHYETFPYPYATPTSEERETGGGIPFVAYYLWGGEVPLAPRTLVAGGGTGNGTMLIAEQYAQLDLGGEIVHLDLSARSIELARLRLKHAGLLDKVKVTFIEGEIERLPEFGVGIFDFINCVGVIHHLKDPALGLRRLRQAMEPHAGLMLMVYGTIGRTGVYHMQQVLRQLFGNVEPLEERVKRARSLLKVLPPTNWLRRSYFFGNIGDESARTDAEIYDLLLHSSDVSYTLPELLALVRKESFEFAAFLQPLLYDIRAHIHDAALLEQILALPKLEQASLVEAFAGNSVMHSMLLSCHGFTPKPEPEVAPEIVPYLLSVAMEIYRKHTTIAQFSNNALGVNISSPVFAQPRLIRVMLGEIDGRSTLREIYERIAIMPESWQGNLTYESFEAHFKVVYGYLKEVSYMQLLRRH
jgi:SAM-dependent methyltransferase